MGRNLIQIFVFAFIIQRIESSLSPLTTYETYQYSTELQPNLAALWWTVDANRQEITFEFHVKTTGWIALGISPAGGMRGADVGLGWIDSNARLHFEDRYASGPTQPILDRNSSDWQGLRGREENGWTAIQFKRPLDSCDDMDVPIKSGTNIVIYAYGMEDPTMNDGVASIGYHENRRYTRMIPLQSYSIPPPESKFNGLDYFEFKLDNYKVPIDETTYHCRVYKAPTNYTRRRHAIAYKTLVNPENVDIVHHLLLYECDPTAVFNDNNLPNGLCDTITDILQPCSANIATGWAIGGDYLLEFPEVAGYPVGGDFEIKYYMVQMHYDNPKRMNNRTDSSGIRFYIGNQMRQHDLGYLTLGTLPMHYAIAIPPNVDRFIIDDYCPSSATQQIPKDGITIVGSFPHTHLQGRSLWTKLIRNKKAEQYLFNAESYDFNYQYGNNLPEPVKIYPGDELATRCIYSTTNKSVITMGGEGTKDEMCMHMFTYYPRMNKFYSCSGLIPFEVWRSAMNLTANMSYVEFGQWLRGIQWNNEMAVRWQRFFDEAPRFEMYGYSGNFSGQFLEKRPTYQDLEAPKCRKLDPINSAATVQLLALIYAIFLSLSLNYFFQ